MTAYLFAAIGTAFMAADLPPPSELPSRSDLPDPLVRLDGTKVTSKEQWAARRDELKRLFEGYMYGPMLPPPKGVAAKLLFEEPAFDGKGVLREYELRADAFPPVRLLVALPAGGKPVGCFVGPNFAGNHVLTDSPKVAVTAAWMYPPRTKDAKVGAAARGTQTDTWPLATIVGRGYAVATFYNGEAQPDRPTTDEGMRAVLKSKTPDEHPNIMLWAWTVSRTVDFLRTLPEIDPKRIAAVGHSRLGKTVLLAAAFDDRIAVAIPSQAGCGGTGPSRHADPKAESVKRINTAFPHWFAPHFKHFGDHLDRLPFDQHCLAAVCAPRPVLFCNATEDLWANPAGQFDMLRRATPVYELLGAKGLEADKVPEPGTLIDSRLGYFLRAGKHAMGPEDWQAYLRYADKWLK